MGQDYKGALKDIDQTRIDVIPWSKIDIYPWQFKTLNIDIGLAPLEKNRFSICKSEIKWEEYSALEIPTVLSDQVPYNIAVKDGETGFLAKTEKDWEESLTKLILDARLRKTIGKKAREVVKDNYDLDKEISQYKKIYDTVLNTGVII